MEIPQLNGGLGEQQPPIINTSTPPLACAPVSDHEKEDSGNDERRRWMTKTQADACKKAFHDWNGSLKGKSAEVTQLAHAIGLSVGR